MSLREMLRDRAGARERRRARKARRLGRIMLSEGAKSRQPRTEGLTMAFDRIAVARPEFAKLAERMRDCGTLRQVAVYEDGSGAEFERTVRANLCKIRGCPNCEAQRSDRISADGIAMVEHHLRTNPTDRLILLTLTVPNCWDVDLRSEIGRVVRAFSKMTSRKKFQRSVKGFVRSLETSWNGERNDYHPHLHVLLVVGAEYFSKDHDLWITQPQWVSLWQSCYGPSVRIVDVRPVVSTMVDGRLGEAGRGAVHEVCKYVVKPHNLLEERPDGTWYADPDVIETMHDALKGRRLLGFGGCLAQARKQLKQGDVEAEDADLIGSTEAPEGFRLVSYETYRWQRGATVAESDFRLVEVIDAAGGGGWDEMEDTG
jgi:plasmid rolling circle replication initiator protein Rep